MPQHQAMRPGHARAFSLIETMAVIVVSAVIAAVAVPSITSLRSTRQASAVNLIARDLAYARERAMSTGVRTWVQFTTASSSYSVLAENPANPGRANAAVIETPGSGKPFTQTFNTAEFAGVTITSVSMDSSSWVGFDWRGSPLNVLESALAARGTVTVSGGKSVSVEPGTGLATVSP